MRRGECPGRESNPAYDHRGGTAARASTAPLCTGVVLAALVRIAVLAGQIVSLRICQTREHRDLLVRCLSAPPGVASPGGALVGAGGTRLPSAPPVQPHVMRTGRAGEATGRSAETLRWCGLRCASRERSAWPPTWPRRGGVILIQLSKNSRSPASAVTPGQQGLPSSRDPPGALRSCSSGPESAPPNRYCRTRGTCSTCSSACRERFAPSSPSAVRVREPLAVDVLTDWPQKGRRSTPYMYDLRTTSLG